MRKPLPLPYVLLSALLLAGTNSAYAAVDPDAIKTKVLALLQEEFPGAQLMPRQGGGFEFALKTREFVLYRGDMTGRWQDPHAETGPDTGGFMVSFIIDNHPSIDQAALPHVVTTDLYVFQESHVIRKSADQHWHLWSAILNPRNKGHAELRTKLMTVFNAFDGP